MQFEFMPEKGTTTLQRMQEEYHDKKRKLFLCFVDMEKAFDRVPRKVMEWAIRKKVELNTGYWKNFLWKLDTPRISAIAIAVCYSV